VDGCGASASGDADTAVLRMEPFSDVRCGVCTGGEWGIYLDPWRGGMRGG